MPISNTDVTNNSITSIIEHLKPSLQKLNVNYTLVDCSKLSELRNMTVLKILYCQHLQYEEIQTLRKQLPDVQIVYKRYKEKPEMCYCWRVYGNCWQFYGT